MTSAHSNAPSSAPSSAHARPSSGVIHIRTRQTSRFTVLANRLAQRAGSAVTVGVAAYILSLPDGAPITIDALCTHFAEGKTAIAAALRELEAEGWLERRVERGPHGRITTRTFAYDLPGVPPEAPLEAAPGAPLVAAEADGPEPTTDPVHPPEPEPAPASAPPAPQAAELLAALPHRDHRLLLSEREITALAPAVTDWLDRGAAPQEITDALTSGLPMRLNRRPARLLAHRLSALRPPSRTSPPPQPDRPPVVPLQNCDGCDRAFRADRPGRCRDCRAPAEVRRAA
ncbi:GntR family transcriptional regulator [Streptomyces sp. ISID311]|uniref:GntR family transcriptional regulator n=1 Tax=Streptomyces sp. ISID311 TaxID=2601673 RepID=UPI0011BD41EF|nr:GntR family transcriptional regulator [Streptomyces sp. ISID311]TXC93664.1 GntR family transcriptional regulator [Streptomyces sp. ISID311]